MEGTPSDYGAITERAIDEFGGIEQFVKKGDRVVLSPNMGWMRTPEQAAATHPDVLRKVVQLCERAGASKITCIDYTLDDWKLAFDICGASSAVRGTQAALLSPTEAPMYQDVDIPAAVPKTHDRTARRTTARTTTTGSTRSCRARSSSATAFICIPVVKDHEAAAITIAMKKLMGNIWNRKDYHRYGLHDCIAELNMALRPTLIVADATRALQTRGPKGPGEVTIPNKVVVGTRPGRGGLVLHAVPDGQGRDAGRRAAPGARQPAGPRRDRLRQAEDPRDRRPAGGIAGSRPGEQADEKAVDHSGHTGAEPRYDRARSAARSARSPRKRSARWSRSRAMRRRTASSSIRRAVAALHVRPVRPVLLHDHGHGRARGLGPEEPVHDARLPEHAEERDRLAPRRHLRARAGPLHPAADAVGRPDLLRLDLPARHVDRYRDRLLYRKGRLFYNKKRTETQRFRNWKYIYLLVGLGAIVFGVDILTFGDPLSLITRTFTFCFYAPDRVRLERHC